MKRMEWAEDMGVSAVPETEEGGPKHPRDFRLEVLRESIRASGARRGAVIRIDEQGTSHVVAVVGFATADDVHGYLLHEQNTVLAALDSPAGACYGAPCPDDATRSCIVPVQGDVHTTGILVLDGIQRFVGASSFSSLLSWADRWDRLANERRRLADEVRDLNGRLEQRVRERTADLRTMLVEQESLARNARLRALGELATGVAHDFNNALSTILGQVHMLTRSDDIPERRLRLIQQAAEDGVATARRIQDFASGHQGPETEDVDVRTWVEDALAMTRTRWQHQSLRSGHAIEVDVTIDPVVSTIRGRGPQLREVLVNLLINAVDAMNGQGRIRVAATLATADRLELTVADTGNGIDESLRRRIFDPFFTTKGSRGTGLGLSVSQGIIAEHGGSIAVQSAKGEGSCFRILLPVREDESPLSAAKRALVIEENEQMRGVLAGMLETVGHRVETRSAGRDGLERFEEIGHDVVLVDLSLQDVPVWDVVDHLRRSNPACTIGLVAGWDSAIDPDALAGSDIDIVISWPLRFEKVVNDLESARKARNASHSP